MCGNGGEVVLCDECSRSICIGSNTQCLGLPKTQESTLHYKDPAVLFVCPPCHQDGDRKAKEPSPYYVRPTPTCDHNPRTHSFKGFYSRHGCTPEETQTRLPVYGCPAKVRGSAQLLPRSKFLSAGVAISGTFILIRVILARSWSRSLPPSFLTRATHL
jgi:hypothetical protein